MSSTQCGERLANSECSGRQRIEEQRLDPEACIVSMVGETEQQSRLEGGSVDYTRTIVRGNIAVVFEIVTVDDGVTDRVVGVMVFEGGGIVSTVSGHQIDRELVIRVSAELHQVGPAGFLDSN